MKTRDVVSRIIGRVLLINKKNPLSLRGILFITLILIVFCQ